MTRRLLALALILVASPISADVSRAASRALRSTVEIRVYNDEGLGVGLASGFAITPSVIVTAAHVVTRGAVFLVSAWDGDKISGHLLGYDTEGDVAVLHVYKRMHPFRFANSDALRHGATVFTVGSPMGLWPSVSEGVISGLHVEGSGNYADLLQTDARANPGSSGGPLCDSRGYVAGMIISVIRTASGQASGYALAVPSNRVQAIARKLLVGSDPR